MCLRPPESLAVARKAARKLGLHGFDADNGVRAASFTGAAYVARLCSCGTAVVSGMHGTSSPSSARSAAAALPSAHRCARACKGFPEAHGSSCRRGERGATRAHTTMVVVTHRVPSRGTVSDTVRRRAGALVQK